MSKQTLTPNIEFGSSVEFLGTQLMAVFRTEESASDKSHTTLVAKQINTDSPQNISLNELADRLVEGVKAIFGDAVDMPTPDVKLPPALADIAENYTVQVKEVLLKVDKTGNETAVMEYAFWIEIGIDQAGLDALKDKPPFNILMLQNLYIKLWNTQNPAILKAMNFVDTDAILGLHAEL